MTTWVQQWTSEQLYQLPEYQICASGTRKSISLAWPGLLLRENDGGRHSTGYQRVRSERNTPHITPGWFLAYDVCLALLTYIDGVLEDLIPSVIYNSSQGEVVCVCWGVHVIWFCLCVCARTDCHRWEPHIFVWDIVSVQVWECSECVLACVHVRAWHHPCIIVGSCLIYLIPSVQLIRCIMSILGCYSRVEALECAEGCVLSQHSIYSL